MLSKRQGLRTRPRLRVDITSLPVEILHMIISRIGGPAVTSLRLTCRLFYSVASEYLYKELVLLSDNSYIRYPETRFSEIQRNIPVKSIEMIPYRSQQIKSSYGSGPSLPLSRKYKDLSDLEQFNFKSIEALHFRSPSVSTINFLTNCIAQYPHIKKLTLNLTFGLLRDSYFRKQMRYLNNLSYLDFRVSWPINRLALHMDLSVLWDVVNANADHLECLRANFCYWETPVEYRDQVARERYPPSSLVALVDSVTNISSLHTPHPSFTFKDPRLRIVFPILKEQWPKQLNLKVVQLMWNPLTYLSLSPDKDKTKFFRPEILEIFSLVDNQRAEAFLSEIITTFENLKYLQVVRSWKTKELVETLPKLRPLIGFYFVALKDDTDLFDYSCLASHQNSLRTLWLEHPPEKKVLEISKRKLVKYGPQWQREATDFSSWPALEELAIVRTREQLKNLIPSPSLQYLRFISCFHKVYEGNCGRLSMNSYQDTTKKLFAKQIDMSNGEAPALKAVSFSPEYTKYSEDPITLAVKWLVSPSNISDKYVSTEDTTIHELQRRLPDVTILGSQNKPWDWIDRFV
ncbi:hypothetical protein ABW19_dt0204253 [Dactylella cylindrospora]|nr:hypothetical protein ABW19_dt0204253 [Dactylella cylindrospora]